MVTVIGADEGAFAGAVIGFGVVIGTDAVGAFDVLEGDGFVTLDVAGDALDVFVTLDDVGVFDSPPDVDFDTDDASVFSLDTVVGVFGTLDPVGVFDALDDVGVDDFGALDDVGVNVFGSLDDGVFDELDVVVVLDDTGDFADGVLSVGIFGIPDSGAGDFLSAVATATESRTTGGGAVRTAFTPPDDIRFRGGETCDKGASAARFLSDPDRSVVDPDSEGVLGRRGGERERSRGFPRESC